jgi:hypothetical protein
MNHLRAFIKIQLAVALLSCAAWGQSGNGTITGQVTDPAGSAVVGAKVTLTEPGTGQIRIAESGANGFYTLTAIRPSTYVISVDQAGFKKFNQAGIVLQASQSLTLNVGLAVGSASENVTVNAQAAAVNTTSQTLQQVVDPTRMVEMPLDARNAASLTTLVAGAVVSPSNNANQGNAKTFPEAVTIAINGTRENQTGYYLDGASAIDNLSNINQPFPFPDALQEFSVQTSNYNAEYGQDAGGVVSVVTKSGTNKFHGNVFEFLRNRVFDAANYFGYINGVKTRDPLKRNQFGGTIGGPVFKEKTFFFGGYQGTRNRDVTNGLSAFTPTAANLTGDFSNITSPIKDPTTGLIIPQPVFINPNRFNPASMALLKDVPVGTGAKGQVFYGTPVIQNFDEYISRVDYNMSAKDTVMGHYYYNRFYNVGSYGGDLLAYRQGSTISVHNATLQEMHIFSSQLLNDFRIGFWREVSIRQPPAGTPNVADFGVPIYQPPTAKAIQSLSISGYFSTGANPTAKFPRNEYSYTDDLHWLHGKHNFAFGGVYARDVLNMVNVLGLPGTFTFSGDTTGNALVDFMLGYMRTFGQANGQHVKNRIWYLNGYAQDSFRMNRRLTLNYGVRYEPEQIYHDLWNQNQMFRPANAAAATINPATVSKVFPNAPAGLLFSGDAGVPLWGTTGDYKNIAPRLGFAYDVFGNGQTSVRAGIGIFYDSRLPSLWNNRVLGSAPYSAAVNLTTPQGLFNNPYLGITNPFPAVFPAPSNSAFVTPVQVYTWDPNHKWITPKVYVMNLAVEQNLGSGFMFRIAYVGSRGQFMTVGIDQNPAVYTPFQTGSTTSACTLSTNQRRRYNNPSGTCNNSAPPATPYSNIYQQSNSGNSWYHSGQFTLSRQLSHGLTLLTNYTWSKSTDSLPFNTDAATYATSGYYVLPLTAPNFRKYDEGLSDFNVANTFVTSYVWQTPKFEKMSPVARGVLGNWETSGIFSAESGEPMNVTAGTDRSQTGIGTDRAQWSGAQAYSKGACGPGCRHWLNQSAFSLPAIGTAGNIGKGQFLNPGFWGWDMAFAKNIPMKERVTMQFRAEMFNIFNHTNFSINAANVLSGGGSTAPVVQANPSSASFGQITGANDPRILQFALKFSF